LSTAYLGWQALQGHYSFDSPVALPALLALLVCTVALVRWLTSSALEVPSTTAHTQRGRFVLAVVLAIGGLFSLSTFIGPPLLFALPVLSLIILVRLRPRLSRQEAAYALSLALVAGVAGLGAGWVSISPLAWAGLQVALILPGLLAGWGLLRHTGLLQAGVGRRLLLSEGLMSAVRAFSLGVLIAMPWAFGLIVLGAANEESWVQVWWQPLAAIQPGIAEEAWGRVLLVPFLFLLFRPLARGQTALTATVVIMAYWFAYLHTSGGFGGMISAVLIGTLYAIPTYYLWLRRGLEAAMGFHFWLDFVKFGIAYLLNQGL